MVAALKESKDISKLTLDELGGSLQAHEVRVNKIAKKYAKKALHVKNDSASSTSGEKGC